MQGAAGVALASLWLLQACGGERATVEHARAEEPAPPERTEPAREVGPAVAVPAGRPLSEPVIAPGSVAPIPVASGDPAASICPDEGDAPPPLTGAVAAAADRHWTAETVPGPFGHGPDDGMALVVLGRDDVLLTAVVAGAGLVAFRKRQGTWTSEVVDPAAGRGDTSVVRDAQGRAHVTYRSQGGALRHAWRQGTGWRQESIDADGHLGGSNALAIDGRGNLTVAYYDEDRHLLKVAHRSAAGPWSIEVVGHGGGQYTLEAAIALDRLERPHVVHSDADARTVRHAFRDVGGWTSEILDTRLVQGHTAIAFDRNGRPAVAYYDTGESQLVVARWTGSCWKRRVVVRALEVSGGWPSLAIGPDDRVHVAFFEGTRDGTQYVVGHGDRWSIETIDAGAVSGPWVGLALDPSGRPWVFHGNVRGAPRLCAR